MFGRDASVEALVVSASIRLVGKLIVQSSRFVALAAWVDHHDSAEWDDPSGKLSLLYDLERVAQLLRDGSEPFHPDQP